jgi:hypothetical protein
MQRPNTQASEASHRGVWACAFVAQHAAPLRAGMCDRGYGSWVEKRNTVVV